MLLWSVESRFVLLFWWVCSLYFLLSIDVLESTIVSACNACVCLCQGLGAEPGDARQACGPGGGRSKRAGEECGRDMLHGPVSLNSLSNKTFAGFFFSFCCFEFGKCSNTLCKYYTEKDALALRHYYFLLLLIKLLILFNRGSLTASLG